MKYLLKGRAATYQKQLVSLTSDSGKKGAVAIQMPEKVIHCVIYQFTFVLMLFLEEFFLMIDNGMASYFKNSTQRPKSSCVIMLAER